MPKSTVDSGASNAAATDPNESGYVHLVEPEPEPVSESEHTPEPEHEEPSGALTEEDVQEVAKIVGDDDSASEVEEKSAPPKRARKTPPSSHHRQ
jgi:hypothetical protein